MQVVIFLACFYLTPLAGTAADKSASWQVRIIATNDIHFYLKPLYHRTLDTPRPWGVGTGEGDYVQKARIEGKIGGMAHVASVIKELKKEMPGRTLHVDTGDTWCCSALSLFNSGDALVDIMNTLGYDAMTPGNWDFYLPKETFLKLVEAANFPILAFNLTDRDWGDPVLSQYVVKQVRGLKVVLLGMTYPWTGATSAARGAAKWWRFGLKQEEAAEFIKEVREKENPDLLILLSHMGYEIDQKFARAVDGIDVIVGSHTHDEVFDPIVWNNTLIFQAGAHGKYVAKLDLTIKDKKVVDYQYELRKIRAKGTKADPEIARLVEQAYAPYKSVLQKGVGETKGTLYRRDYWSSPMGNLLTDALRDIAETDIALFPAWRFGATVLPGAITVEDVYNMVPTKWNIATYSMSGTNIKRLLERILDNVLDSDPYLRVGGDMIRFSGMKLRVDPSRPQGSRIVEIRIGKKPLVPDQKYTVSSSQLRFYKNPFFGAFDIHETNKIFSAELIVYLAQNSPIVPTLDKRIDVVGRLTARGSTQ